MAKNLNILVLYIKQLAFFSPYQNKYFSDIENSYLKFNKRKYFLGSKTPSNQKRCS